MNATSITTRLTAVLGLCLVLASACGAPGQPGGTSSSAPSAHVSPGALCGRLFSDTPLLLYPGRGWRGAPKKMRWQFSSPATMVCQVNRRLETGLRLSLLPAKDPLGISLLPFWNGYAEPAITAHTAGGRVEIVVPPELLVPGSHRLTLALPAPDGPGRREKLLFERIEYECGPLAGVLRPDRSRQLKRTAGFLAGGVLPAGEGRPLQGGFLFKGPYCTRAGLDLGAPALFTVEAGNRSKGEARFAIAGGLLSAAAAVPPGGTKTLQLRLPPGKHVVSFTVEGPESGYFWWGAPTAFPEQPSDLVPIIIITLDTTRRDAVSPYAAAEDTTPALRSFADEATVFTRAFAASPWTLPSHASIFTGRYPSEHGAGVRWSRLPPGSETLASLLRDRGYLTAGFAGGPLSASRFGVAQGFTHYRDPVRSRNRARHLTRAAIKYLDSAGTAPLFLFINYFDPHFPYVAPREFRRRYQVPQLKTAMAGVPDWPELISGDDQAFKRVESSGQPPPEEALRCLRAAYRSEVAYVDQQLGLLFDELRRRDLYDRAFIAILSDHGEFLGEHGFYSHSFRLDPELIEIPCLVKWPGQSTREVVDLPVSQVDLFPTILQLAGIPPRPSSGVCLQPGRIDNLAGRPFLLMEEHSQPEVHSLGPRPARLADHLYGLVAHGQRVWAWDGGHRCSRREGDRWVDQPCAGHWSETLDVVRGRFGAGNPAATPQAESLEEEERENLRQLGYLE